MLERNALPNYFSAGMNVCDFLWTKHDSICAHAQLHNYTSAATDVLYCSKSSIGIINGCSNAAADSFSSPCCFTAPPTDFGPLQSSKHHLEKQQSHLPSVSVYRSAYQRHPLSALCQRRFASASRVLSSHLYAANHKYKDLDLRQRPLLQVPGHCPRLLPSSQRA